MNGHAPGSHTAVGLDDLRNQPTAIGYLRTDLCGHTGFVTARLRLAAIAHGYRLRRLVELPAYPDPDHLTILRTTLARTTADGVIIAWAAHLPGRQLPALRALTPVIVDTAVLPKISGFSACLHLLFDRAATTLGRRHR
ncbi:hypothetical protein [Nocardia carnea]|uniref:hypothetical protein n=1 Tax=Nocardia carnea TaxID=37328 RepID=UPI0024539A80|nr:hypothetical protein [Nocardia carnea]